MAAFQSQYLHFMIPTSHMCHQILLLRRRKQFLTSQSCCFFHLSAWNRNVSLTSKSIAFSSYLIGKILTILVVIIWYLRSPYRIKTVIRFKTRLPLHNAHSARIQWTNDDEKLQKIYGLYGPEQGKVGLSG